MIGNLDAEEEMAGGRRTLPAAARGAASGFATLLRAFTQEGDRLWTLAPVEADRVVPVPGLPRPELMSGPTARLEGLGGPILAWAETPSVHRARRGSGGREGRRDELPELVRALWKLRVPDPETVARVDHRAFAVEVADELGRDDWLLPGARIVRSVSDLVRHLESGGAEVSGGAWVAKAPWSAAGRHRVIGDAGAGARSREVGRRLENLLERFGSLLVEPWVSRSADFGCSALVTGEQAGAEETVRIVGIHRTEVDRRGAFAGLEIAPRGTTGTPREAERSALEEVARRIGERLAGAGYTGPFGVDAFRWTDRAGVERFHPLSEVNARLTFGWVGRALVDRLREPLGIGEEDRVALRFGRSMPEAAGIVPLLHPGADAPGAWLRIGGPGGDQLVRP